MMIIQIWYIQIIHWVKLNTLKCPKPKIPTSPSFADIPAPEGGLRIIVGRQIILKRAGFRPRRLHPRGWCWAPCFEGTKNLRNHRYVLTLKQFQGEKKDEQLRIHINPCFSRFKTAGIVRFITLIRLGLHCLYSILYTWWLLMGFRNQQTELWGTAL